jgi:hypothetical protein
MTLPLNGQCRHETEKAVASIPAYLEKRGLARSAQAIRDLLNDVEDDRNLAFAAFLAGYDEGWDSRGDDHYWAKPFLRERFRRWLDEHRDGEA